MNFFKSEAGRLTIILAVYVISALLIGLIIALFGAFSMAMTLVSIACAVIGWHALGFLRPAMFMHKQTYPKLTLFVIVKALLAVPAGLLTAPYFIGKAIGESI